jgi:hypothetical protein
MAFGALVHERVSIVFPAQPGAWMKSPAILYWVFELINGMAATFLGIVAVTRRPIW